MGEKDIAEKILMDNDDVFADVVNGLIFDGSNTCIIFWRKKMEQE